MQIAVSSYEISVQVDEILHFIMKYYCDSSDFDGLDEHLRSYEEQACHDLNAAIVERGFPVEVQRLSVMAVVPKNGAVLTRKQAALERRIAEDRYSLSLEQLEKKFDLERVEAKSKEELKAVGRHAQVDLNDRENRLRADLIRTYAQINHEFGEDALPVEVRRELLLARAAVSAQDLERLKELIDQIVVRSPANAYVLGTSFPLLQNIQPNGTDLGRTEGKGDEGAGDITPPVDSRAQGSDDP